MSCDECSKMRSELQAAQAAALKIAEEYGQACIELAASQREVKELEEKIVRNEGGIHRTIQLEKDLLASQREVADLRESYDTLHDQRHEEARKCDRLAEEMELLKTKHANQMVSIERFQEQRREQEEEITDLRHVANVEGNLSQTYKAELAASQRELADYKKTVSKIWEILGNPSYESLKGKSIFDLITGLQAENAELKAECERLEAYAKHHDIISQDRSRLQSSLDEATAQKDGAYLERNKLVALLARVYPSGIAKTSIEGWSEDWHGCVFIDLPTGQASWHYHDSQAWLFETLPPYQGVWDGHTTEEKYKRVEAAFLAAQPQPQGEK